jgi:hypothetical protein
MLFIAVTILSLLGVLFGRTFLRFRAGAVSPRSRELPSLLREYSGWLGDGVRALFEHATPARALALYKAWVVPRYPGWRQWAFIAFAASFAFCAATGIFFAIFVPRGMFGIPLLFHVMAGGLFAVSLAAVLLLRAGAYRPDAESPAGDFCVSCPVLKSVPRRYLVAGLFWILTAAGFVIAVTALLSMLPVLHFAAQLPLLETHRYAALAALLAAIVFFDLDILPRRG